MRVIISTALLIVLIVCIYLFRQQQRLLVDSTVTNTTSETSNTKSDTESKNKQATRQQTAIPSYVLETLNYILKYDKAPDGYVGGRIYFNRNKALPQRDASQAKIQYREWDVHPKRSGQNRGPERLVTGSDLSAYFTKDHYNHFIKIHL